MKAGVDSPAFFWFTHRSGQPRPAARSRRHPDKGEDNPNRNGAVGNGVLKEARGSRRLSEKEDLRGNSRSLNAAPRRR